MPAGTIAALDLARIGQRVGVHRDAGATHPGCRVVLAAGDRTARRVGNVATVFGHHANASRTAADRGTRPNDAAIGERAHREINAGAAMGPAMSKAAYDAAGITERAAIDVDARAAIAAGTGRSGVGAVAASDVATIGERALDCVEAGAAGPGLSLAGQDRALVDEREALFKKDRDAIGLVAHDTAGRGNRHDGRVGYTTGLGIRPNVDAVAHDRGNDALGHARGPYRWGGSKMRLQSAARRTKNRFPSAGTGPSGGLPCSSVPTF